MTNVLRSSSAHGKTLTAMQPCGSHMNAAHITPAVEVNEYMEETGRLRAWQTNPIQLSSRKTPA